MNAEVPLQVEQAGTALTPNSSLYLSVCFFFFFNLINASGDVCKFLSCRLDESKAHGHIGFVGLGVFFGVFYEVFWHPL